MANQRNITLRPGDATPKNIVLRPLPLPDTQIATIYLCPGETPPNNIRLKNPALPCGGGGTSWTVNVSDTITLSDVIFKTPGLGKTDTTTLSDAVAKSVGKLQSDTITLTDATARSVVVARSDTITLTDNTAKAVGKQQTDTITLSDFESHVSGTGHTKSLADTITLTDVISVVVPPQPPFPPVFLGGGGTEIGHPRMKVLKLERRDDDIEELEIVEILTCWLGKN